MCADSVLHKHNIRFEECMQSQEINSMNSYAVHGIIFSVYFVKFFFLFSFKGIESRYNTHNCLPFLLLFVVEIGRVGITFISNIFIDRFL